MSGAACARDVQQNGLPRFTRPHFMVHDESVHFAESRVIALTSRFKSDRLSRSGDYKAPTQ